MYKTKYKGLMISRNGLLAFAIASTLFAAGCQQEETQIIEPPADQVFTNQSDVATLIQQTSMNDGSIDNIVDGASCTSLQLPVTISVNGVQITLDSADDFNVVENILDRYSDDEDDIDFAFPITVLLADFSIVTLNNEDQYEDFIDQCTEDSVDDDIECVDFKFPLAISIYNSDNQVSDVVTIDNDEEIHDFIHDLDENEYAGFDFPITVILSDSTEIVINNNDELKVAIASADGTCDEDDDIDHDDDDVNSSDFSAAISNGNWNISYYFEDEDETGDFAGYLFTFNNDGTAKAVKGASTTNGAWYANGNDGSLEIVMNFGDNESLDELDEDWQVIQYDNLTVKLKHVSGGDGSTDFLTFSRP